MSEVIRIAHIIDVMDNGGIEEVVMNYYRNIDRNKVQFDFITSDISKLPQKEEILSLGGKIYLTPRFTNIFNYNKALKKIFMENKYSIVHCHMGTLAVFPLRVAKKCGVKVRICHAHSTTHKAEWKRNIIKSILKPFSKKYSTHYFACSEYAGKWLFGENTFNKGKVKVINNAIDVRKFKYDEKGRVEIRKALGIKDNYVIGHIGRFVKQKNHEFLIETFNEVSKKNSSAILMLVGDGPLRPEIEKKVNSFGLTDKVMFLGIRNDCNKLYQAMDVFALPSLYEGLPVVGVEAQCSGLKCLFSDTTTKEIEILNCTKRLPLDKNIWANELIDIDTPKDRNVENFRLDIIPNAERLLNLYFEIIEEKL